MRSFIYFICLTSVFACTSKSDVQQTEKATIQYGWIKQKQSDWPQIVLTNSVEFNNRIAGASYGASAFLVWKEKSQETFMCTAKHLLGEAMGISPAVPVDSFDVLLEKWEVLPRQTTICSDTLEVTNIVSNERNKKDIALFNIKAKKHAIQALKPRFDSVKVEEELFIVGCDYADNNCHQQVYKTTAIGYNDEGDGQLITAMVDPFTVNGFSGAPVIDKNGLVVGVLCSTAQGETMRYLYIEPIYSVKKWLE